MYYTNKNAAYEKIHDKIKESNIVCMRETNKWGVGKIIGVSYSEEGLRGVANKSGRYIYSGAANLQDAYKLPRARNVVVTKFVPNDKPTKEEVLWIDKAYRLLNIR